MKVRRNAAKWSSRSAAAAPEFATGVADPRADWQRQTTEATSRYKEGVTASIQRGSWEKGVARAGTETWQRKTLAKGPQRYAEGVGQATSDYETAVGPYLDVIERTQLPQRFATGDPRNVERTKVIAAALHAAKMQRTSK